MMTETMPDDWREKLERSKASAIDNLGSRDARERCYALSGAGFSTLAHANRYWPWAFEWWKPSDRRHDLVKAGALILAEIQRLDRAEANAKQAAP